MSTDVVPDDVLQGALQHVEVVALDGVIKGQFYLSPPFVRRTLIDGAIARSPLALTAHAEFSVNHATNARLLAPYNHGIFASGVRFPDICCVCRAARTRFQIFEAGLNESRYLYKVSFEGLTDERRKALRAACVEKRFWCLVPFCAVHGFVDEIHVDSHSIDFRNKEYARVFARLNGIEGRWIRRMTLATRFCLQWLAVALICVAAVRYALTTYPVVEPGDWIGIGLFVGAFILLVASIEIVVGRREIIR